MKIYSAIQIGDYHLNHCEDALYIGKFGKDKLVFALMDGCTMALESHFASTLVGKILKKIVVEKGYEELIGKGEELLTLEQQLQSILKKILLELKICKNQLLLDQKELLTTLMLMVIDQAKGQGIILVIGDGFVNINGKINEFEQNNKPDYLGFHLADDFDSFYNSQTQLLRFDKIEDISLSTDGIFSFTKIHKATNDEVDVIDFLTNNKNDSEQDTMLNMKLKTLENEFGLKPTDDFSMIRIIQN